MDKLKKYVASGDITETRKERSRRFNSKYFAVVVAAGATLPLLIGWWLISNDNYAVSRPSNATTENRVGKGQHTVRLEPTEYQMTMTAAPIGDTQIEFTVSTNAPVPIQIMADVTLVGQLDHETWIGEQRKVTLDKPTTSFVLDTTSNGKRLPAGQYNAEVSYYARWGGANNPAAQHVPNLSASQQIALEGFGETAEHARDKASAQRWVLGEMDLSRAWSDAELRAQLGPFKSYESPNAIRSVIYYFPESDVSLFVDPARGKVFHYELGRVR